MRFASMYGPASFSLSFTTRFERAVEETPMYQAYIIETGDLAAGIVTREKRGFLFHSATALFRSLDGQTFDSPQRAQRAAETLRRDKRRAQRASE